MSQGDRELLKEKSFGRFTNQWKTQEGPTVPCVDFYLDRGREGLLRTLNFYSEGGGKVLCLK